MRHHLIHILLYCCIAFWTSDTAGIKEGFVTTMYLLSVKYSEDFSIKNKRKKPSLIPEGNYFGMD